MKPTARPADVTLSADGTHAVHRQAGREHRLPADAGHLWPHLDGQRSVADLAARLGWSADRLGAALDALADRDLLVARAAPPAMHLPVAGHSGLSRREILQRLAAGAALAATGRAALADDARVSSSSTADTAKESAGKEEAEKAVQSWETKVSDTTRALTEAETCQRETAKLSEKDQKDRACGDTRAIREEQAKARSGLTAAKQKEADLKNSAKERARESSTKDR